jgi:hypothetical protein
MHDDFPVIELTRVICAGPDCREQCIALVQWNAHCL